MTCPFCEVEDAELVSLFGSQLLFSQYRCGACGSYFEGVREDRAEAPANAAEVLSGVQRDGSPSRDGEKA